jgi:hypothetical protein
MRTAAFAAVTKSGPLPEPRSVATIQGSLSRMCHAANLILRPGRWAQGTSGSAITEIIV